MKRRLATDSKLLVIDIFKKAISLVCQNGFYLFKLISPVLFIMVAIDLIRPSLGSLNYEYLDFYNLYSPYMFYILMFLGLVSAVLSTLFATSAHQFTLYEPSQRPKQALRLFGKKELKYFLRSLQITVVAGIVFSLVFFILKLLFRWDFAWLIVAAIAVVVSAYCVARLAIVLPETAIGNETSLTRAWSLSEGNGLRILLVVMIIPIGFILLVAYLPPILFLYFNIIFPNPIIVLLSYLLTFFSLITLSLSYRFLIEFYEPA